MNKKFCVVALSAIVLSFNPYRTLAQNPSNNGTQIPLTVEKIKDTELGNGYPKGPIPVPYVILDDHTLYIWSQHNGYTLTLLDDNDTVVYQSYVAPGVQYVALPTTLSGSFTLILSDDTYMFTGMIDLE